MTEQEVYQFYNEIVKIAYSEIEARKNIIPVELLFEIHSAFDHLKRFHLGEEEETAASTKAYSHLKRGVLDAYKLKLKYFNEDYEKYFKKNPELRIIDSGRFYPRALKLKKEIVSSAKVARITESKKENDVAFENWYKTSLLIDEFEDEFFDVEKLSWSKKQGYFQFGFNFLIGIIAGVIASAIFAYIMFLLNKWQFAQFR